MEQSIALVTGHHLRARSCAQPACSPKGYRQIIVIGRSLNRAQETAAH